MMKRKRPDYRTELNLTLCCSLKPAAPFNLSREAKKVPVVSSKALGHSCLINFGKYCSIEAIWVFFTILSSLIQPWPEVWKCGAVVEDLSSQFCWLSSREATLSESCLQHVFQSKNTPSASPKQGTAGGSRPLWSFRVILVHAKLVELVRGENNW